jgi:D-alanyl-D-alanine carboxypeptidase
MDRQGVSRRSTMALALGAVSVASAGFGRGRAVDPGWARVDAAARQLVESHTTPGISVSVLRKGSLVYSKGFGLSNLETQTVAAPDSVYLIGSLTKQFTAASVMLLAEAGKLSVDDPLSRYLPDFPRGGEITLRQILTHTAGLGEYIDKNFAQASRVDYDADALYKVMLATRPLFAYAPGTVWAYSDTAYVLLGLIVQKVSGRPYGSFFRDGVIRRAGLSETAVDDAADVMLRRASGYTVVDGAPGRWNNAGFISRSYAGGAGSMRSTGEDLCRWHEALLSGRVVSAKSLKEMTTPQRLSGGALPIKASAPGETASPAPVKYGFGLETALVDGRQTIGHLGHITGFSATLLTFPAESVSIALLANCRVPAGPWRDMLQQVVAAGVHADFSRRDSVLYG